MPEVRPFRGYHYSPSKVGDLKLVLSPPYDVISQEEREILHNMSPYNIVRIIGGKGSPDDDARSGRRAPR